MIGFGLPLFAMAQALTSCGDDDGGGGGACTPGEVRACAVPGQSCNDGVQTCNGDGSAYSACACGGTGTAGSGGSAGSGGGGNAGAAGAGGNVGGAALYPDGSRPIGAPCETDSDCPAATDGTQPLICIPSTDATVFGSGGPQGGYCTIPCDGEAQSGTTDCRALDSLSFCFPGLNHCIGVCLAGGDTAICPNGGRAQACYDLEIPDNEGIGACLPVCQSDAACGEGQYCDFGFDGGLGLCTPTSTPPIGTGGVGAPCSPETQDADCVSGICLEFTNEAGATASFCSATCTFNSLAGCGFGNDAAEGTREAACLFPQLLDGGAGDAGLCIELCDADTDCEQDGFVCDATGFDADTLSALGRLGQCVPSILIGAGGGADAGVDAGN